MIEIEVTLMCDFCARISCIECDPAEVREERIYNDARKDGWIITGDNDFCSAKCEKASADEELQPDGAADAAADGGKG
jgi:hypothetical protein